MSAVLFDQFLKRFYQFRVNKVRMARQQKKISDMTLVQQFNGGSIEAFEELLGRYETKVFNLALRFMHTPEDAEDVQQEVWSTLYRKLHRFEGKSAFSSWLYRIVVNASFMRLRKKRQDQSILLEDLAGPVRESCLEGDTMALKRADSLATDAELRAKIQLAIDKLPEQYRAVFVLRDVDGLPNNEVGKLLKLSVPAVKSRLHRSRLMLRKRLRRVYEDFVGRKISDSEIEKTCSLLSEQSVAA